MKATIISGCRDFEDLSVLERALSSLGWDIPLVVEGGARGVDNLALMWARDNGVEVKTFPADWSVLGAKAGPIRNRKMADFAARYPAGGRLLALWDGKSRGTASMISEATKAGLEVAIWPITL